MIVNFFKDWFCNMGKDLFNIISVLYDIILFILYPIVELFISIFILLKYVFYTQFKVKKWTDKECKNVYNRQKEKEKNISCYIPFGIRINNKIIMKKIEKRISVN